MAQQVNLYNAALAPKVEVFSGRSVLLALLGVLAVSLAAWSALGVDTARAVAREAEQAARLAQLQSDVTRLAQQLAARKPDAQLQQELASLDALLMTRNEVLSALQGGALGDTRGVSEYFRAFARQSVEGVWLTSFSISGAGSQIAIQGRTVDAELVPSFLTRLSREETLRGHGFESLTVSRPAAAVSADGKLAAQPAYLEFRIATSAHDQHDGAPETSKPGGTR